MGKLLQHSLPGRRKVAIRYEDDGDDVVCLLERSDEERFHLSERVDDLPTAVETP